MLTRTEIVSLGVILMRDANCRLSALMSTVGSCATSFHALAMVFASLMMLCPLVSVPAIDGNFCNCWVVVPICRTNWESCAVLAARVSVAGSASFTMSVRVWFLVSSWSASCAVCVSASEICADRVFNVPSRRLESLMRSPKAWP
ncbi:Uncharacterised protein [Mycobacteroides abscessus]|nr:Uncharacterised protein [Mycobacteroides abscessus]